MRQVRALLSSLYVGIVVTALTFFLFSWQVEKEHSSRNLLESVQREVLIFQRQKRVLESRIGQLRDAPLTNKKLAYTLGYLAPGEKFVFTGSGGEGSPQLENLRRFSLNSGSPASPHPHSSAYRNRIVSIVLGLVAFAGTLGYMLFSYKRRRATERLLQKRSL